MSSYSIIINSAREALSRVSGDNNDIEILSCIISTFDNVAYYFESDKEKIRKSHDKLRKIADGLRPSIPDWVRDGIAEITNDLR